MAKKLGQVDFDLGDPTVEVMKEDETGKVEEEGDEDKLVDVLLEEDDDMYMAAGLPAPSTSQQQQPVDLAATINSAVQCLSGLDNGNISVKIVVVSGNTNTTMNF